MDNLQQVAQRDPIWSLEQLVEVVNTLLPQFLPEAKAHTRVREDMTSRLVRHYTSQGLLDEPSKAGREARYTYRHLLQILVVRRLLVEGYGASAINTLARSKTNAELEALLQGGVHLTLAPSNPALAFLQQIQQRPTTQASSPPPAPPAVPAHPSQLPSSLPTASHWVRVEIIPGLEIHIRDDFTLPATAQEQQTLLQQILQRLISFTTRQKRSTR